MQFKRDIKRLLNANQVTMNELRAFIELHEDELSGMIRITRVTTVHRILDELRRWDSEECPDHHLDTPFVSE